MDHTAIAQASAALNIVHEIATLLDTGLDKEEVAILVALIENGVNPEVLPIHLKGLWTTWAAHQSPGLDIFHPQASRPWPRW